MVRPRVFLDFAVNNEPVGRVIFELFNDSAPRTCENFRALCTGEKGLSPSGNPLYFKNSILHRCIKDFMLQGGDFTKRNGSGGESIYGGTFADEDLTRSLESEGLLCMANKGPNTNGSQFFITLRDCPHLNGKHVVFGKVIRGYEEVVQRLARVSVDEKDRPTTPILISNCGELELRKQPTPAVKDSSHHIKQEEDTHSSSRRRPRRSLSSSSDIEESQPKKSKRKKRIDGAQQEKSQNITKETEEEYDARLEREENERIEIERTRVLQRIKSRYEAELQPKDGVRFKGRGRMKFVDPEGRQSSQG